MASGGPAFSLVIPAHDEERYLPALLASLEVARAAYPGGADAIEVVVADNGSSDRTAELARAAGCGVVAVERRSIGAARNGGAAVARAPVLCFVDADTRIHPATFHVVAAAMDHSHVAGGSCGAVPERWSPALRLLSLTVVPLRLLGIDTGVVFCRRSCFERAGGYREDLLVGEDVEFLWRLRRLARDRGQRLLRPPGATAVASIRKFDRHGHWRFLGIMARLAWDRLFAPQRFRDGVWRYWYRDR